MRPELPDLRLSDGLGSQYDGIYQAGREELPQPVGVAAAGERPVAAGK
jgi:hypothetical protein